ncbi:hypothetical protein EUX98_g9771, partial [Antrodiella citrinella]
FAPRRVPRGVDSESDDDSDEEEHGDNNDGAGAELSRLLNNKVVYDYPVPDFISAVFGISKDDLKVPAHGLFLSEEDCEIYNVAGYASHRRDERSAYGPLMNILESLGGQLEGNVKDRRLNDSDMKDYRVFTSGDFGKHKPELLASWVDWNSKLKRTWRAAAIVGELKKSKTSSKNMKGHTCEIHLDRIPKLRYVPILLDPEDIYEPQVTLATENKKRKAGSPPYGQRRSAPKRPRFHDRGDLNRLPSPSCLMNPKANDSPVIKSLHELLSHGVRSYATGFRIQDFTMTLYYMDRMGVVVSEPFDFMDQPHFLLLYVAAIRYASPAQLGFFSKLGFLDDNVTDTLDGATLDLPGSADIDSKTLNDLRFVLEPDRPIIHAHGAQVGRATIVVPVKPFPRCEAAVVLCEENRIVAKIAWQSTSRRISEDSYIRVARTKLQASDSMRKHLKHIVDMKCALTQSMEEMKLSRVFMFGLPEEDAENHRVCRILVMMEYIPLEMVDSVREFKLIFVGVIKGHHAVYETSRILHRDISINNIMFYRDSQGGAIGVLCVVPSWTPSKLR